MSKKPLEKGQQLLNLFFKTPSNATSSTSRITMLNNENSTSDKSSTLPKPNFDEYDKPAGDLGTDKPSQPVIDFPKTICDSHRRSFQKEWYRQFPWVEYSIERDAVVCFACLNFLPAGFQNSDPAFTSSGFKNWKKALDQGRGLIKHAECQSHIKAFSAWKEIETRDGSSTSVSYLLGPTQLENYRYYIKSIAKVIQFLVVNELSLRETYCTEIEKESGIFTNLCEYTFKQDNKLQSIASKIPDNASYVSLYSKRNN